MATTVKALTHPYLARAWAKRGIDICAGMAPGTSQKSSDDLRLARSSHAPVDRARKLDQRGNDFIAHLEQL